MFRKKLAIIGSAFLISNPLVFPSFQSYSRGLDPIRETIQRVSHRLNQSIPRTSTEPMKIALRIPGIEVFEYLEKYRNGSAGKIPFIYYGNINTMEQINARGATVGDNKVYTGVILPCDNSTIPRAMASVERWARANLTYIMLDCEKGSDGKWSQPDVVQIASQLAPIVNAAGRNFRLQIAMQYGYLENAPDGVNGDKNICRHDFSTCDLGNSYAGLVWKDYNANDVVAVFGRSGQQRTADNFYANNIGWINFIKQNYPKNGWWGVSGLVDKNKDGVVDLSPAALFEIAKKADEMGAQGLGIVWLGKSTQELVGKQTQLDKFLDLWANYQPSSQ